jgi:hypothetical protein
MAMAGFEGARVSDGASKHAIQLDARVQTYAGPALRGLIIDFMRFVGVFAVPDLNLSPSPTASRFSTYHLMSEPFAMSTSGVSRMSL